MDKDRIISEIKRTAAINNGIALGKLKFLQETGIKESDWHGKFWVKWSDAILEAGLTPNAFNSSIDENYLLQKISDLISEIGCFPTTGHLKLKSQNDKDFPNNKVFYNRFGNKAGLTNAVRDYAEKHRITEIISLIPESSGKDNFNDLESTEPLLGFVYLYKSKQYYKIGRTNNSSRRNREIKLQLPFEVQLVHSISTDDPVGIERYWHLRFAEKRLNGEWFQLSATDIKAFKKRKFM